MLAGFVQGLPARSDLPRGCYCCDGSGLLRRPLFLIDVFYRSPKSTFCAVFGLVSSLLMFSSTDFTNSWSSLHGARVSLQLSSSARTFAFGIRQLEIPTQCLDPPPTDFPPNAREPSSSRLHAAMTKIILIKSRITTCSLSSVPHTLLATRHSTLVFHLAL